MEQLPTNTGATPEAMDGTTREELGREVSDEAVENGIPTPGAPESEPVIDDTLEATTAGPPQYDAHAYKEAINTIGKTRATQRKNFGNKVTDLSDKQQQRVEQAEQALATGMEQQFQQWLYGEEQRIAAENEKIKTANEKLKPDEEQKPEKTLTNQQKRIYAYYLYFKGINELRDATTHHIDKSPTGAVKRAVNRFIARDLFNTDLAPRIYGNLYEEIHPSGIDIHEHIKSIASSGPNVQLSYAAIAGSINNYVEQDVRADRKSEKWLDSHWVATAVKRNANRLFVEGVKENFWQLNHETPLLSGIMGYKMVQGKSFNDVLSDFQIPESLHAQAVQILAHDYAESGTGDLYRDGDAYYLTHSGGMPRYLRYALADLSTDMNGVKSSQREADYLDGSGRRQAMANTYRPRKKLNNQGGQNGQPMAA